MEMNKFNYVLFAADVSLDVALTEACGRYMKNNIESPLCPDFF